jgi:hypothetical protein
VVNNVVGTRFLISNGADKQAVDMNRQNPLQAIQENGRDAGDFGDHFENSSGEFRAIKKMLRG